MKKIFKINILFLILFMPCFIHAKSYNYDNTISRTNQYISTFKDYTDYLKIESMPYNYEGGENKKNVNFKHGGILSRDEYSITNTFGNSYLATGLEYWTLTQADHYNNHVINFALSQKPLEEKTGVRVTEFVKNETKVMGAGTKSDPWVFLSIKNVNLYSSDENRGTLSLTKCDSKNDGHKNLVVPIYDEYKGIFYVCEDKYYRYYKTTCSKYMQKEIDSDKMYIDSSIQDNTICRMDFGYVTYDVELLHCENCTQIEQKHIYLATNKDNYFSDEYGENIITKINMVPNKTGYTYNGYYKTNAFIPADMIIDVDGNIISKEINSDIDLHPYMIPNKYKVTFDVNSGNALSVTSKQVTYDNSYGELPQPTKTGYTFAGWYTSSTGGTQITSSDIVKITSNQTLYAHWTANEYTVTFDSNGGNITTLPVKQVTYDQNYGTLSTVNRTGYTFAGWYTNKTGGEKIETSTKVSITSNQTLYAHWTANSYTVTFNANGGNTPSISTKNVTYDETYGTLASISRTGYTFDGWYTAISGGTKIVTTTKVEITSNQTLYAHWTANKYTVTFNANGGSTPNPQTKTVTYDETYGTLATSTYGTNIFNGWYTSASGGTKITSTTKVSITSNQTLYAQWQPPTSVPSFTYTGTFALLDKNGYEIASGTNKKVTVPSSYANYTGNWKLKFLTNGTLTFHTLGAAKSGIDVFLVGGGGGGGNWSYQHQSAHEDFVGGGGGGGGYTTTVNAVGVTVETSYVIGIGSGGGPQSGGGASTGFGYSASGGGGAYKRSGGSGGSGGGAGGCDDETNAGGGGSNGGSGGVYESGKDGCTCSAGSGQGRTTGEFGDSSATRYGGGGGGGAGADDDYVQWSGAGGGSNGAGGGGRNSNGGSATPNTGGGGGGASGKNRSAGSGGTGIVIIRNKQ